MLKIGDKVQINLEKYPHAHGRIGIIEEIKHYHYGIICTVKVSKYYGADFTASTLIKIPEKDPTYECLECGEKHINEENAAFCCKKKLRRH